ncbi:MAG: Fe-S cluster protein [Candidatus Methanoplasma sp.]|jgi:uncharacterized Fe-S cluster-containing protein|nr:Fe-S cluster protein [Candidatus Methanoplasma sp.]
MQTTYTAANEIALPGKNCGACGVATCDEFRNSLAAGTAAIGRCPHIITVSDAPKERNVVTPYSGIDVVGQKYDFYLAPLPGEPSARKIVLPFRSDLVEKWNIVPGDIVTGRPAGAGCPVQHVLKVISADPYTGVITGHVVGPSYARGAEVKDVRQYHMLGFDGLAIVVNNEPEFGKRFHFLPGLCMLGRAHTGLVNMVLEKPWGLQIRIENILIL